MDCPKCVGKLQHKQVENVEIDVCFVCEGIWFDENELKKIITLDSQDFKHRSFDREEFDGKEISGLRQELDKKEAVCPRCGNGVKLVSKEYHGKNKINVDVCAKCNGIWLDGGEISELRKRDLVDMKDKLDQHASFLQYIFSQKGFKLFTQGVFRKG